MIDRADYTEETELMHRIAQGDEAAFREVVDTHRQRVYDLCFRYVQNHADAEEVAQDVFIRLYRSAASWKPQAKLSTFLYRIAMNLSLNRIRDRKRRRLLSLDQFRKDDGGLDLPASDQHRPDKILERREAQERVRRAIEKLPEKQRTVVMLRRYQELSYQEIADVMQCSVQSVESRLFRARQKLKQLLS